MWDSLCDSGLQRIEGSGLERTELLFEFRPAFLDGIEVGGVGRQGEQFRSSGVDQLADPGDLVRTEVVHHDDLAGLQPGAQDLFQVTQEDLAVGGRFDGHGRDQALGTHRAQHGQRAPVPGGRGLAHALAA